MWFQNNKTVPAIAVVAAGVLIAAGLFVFPNLPTSEAQPLPEVDIRANDKEGAFSLPFLQNLWISWCGPWPGRICANATSCTVSGPVDAFGRITNWSGTKGLDLFLTPDYGSYTFTLECTGPGGTAQDSVTVTFPPPTIDYSLLINGAIAGSPFIGPVIEVAQESSVQITITANLVSGSGVVNFLSVTDWIMGDDAKTIPGVNYSFSPISCSPTCKTTLTMSTTVRTPLGSHTLIVQSRSGPISRVAYFTLNVMAPPISVTLAATPSLGPAPLTTTLEAVDTVLTVPEGGPAVTRNFSFWWNCSSPTTNVAAAETACGDLLDDPAGGGCTENANGAKCDGETASSRAVSHTYAIDDTYTAKVIAEKDAAPSDEERTTVTVRPVVITALPDLTTQHRDIDINGTLAVGRPLTFTSNILNQGGSDTAVPDPPGIRNMLCVGKESNVLLAATDPDAFLESGPWDFCDLNNVPNLKAGAASSLFTSREVFLYKAETYRVQWCADFDDKVVEANETEGPRGLWWLMPAKAGDNNCTFKNFTVVEPETRVTDVATFCQNSVYVDPETGESLSLPNGNIAVQIRPESRTFYCGDNYAETRIYVSGVAGDASEGVVRDGACWSDFNGGVTLWDEKDLPPPRPASSYAWTIAHPESPHNEWLETGDFATVACVKDPRLP